MPNKDKILTDYEPSKRPNKKRKKVEANPDTGEIQHQELELPMVREFAIHILQSIHYL